MSVRRSDRLVDMTHFFLNHPHQLISLTHFSHRYNAAKSSISEDLVIIKRTFAERNIGILETVPGAAGGVRYIPKVSDEEAKMIVNHLCQRLSEQDRLLPGGYVYLSDLLGNTELLRAIGLIVASKYANQNVDVVMTIATKGIPIAQAVANYLNVPFVIVRRDSKITEGATVSVNYVSGSSSRIQKMELSKRSLKENSRVLIVDDFMKAGGTINGMKSIVHEFGSTVVGSVVFAESAFKGERMVDDYVSLLCVEKVDTATRNITVVPGNYFNEEN